MQRQDVAQSLERHAVFFRQRSGGVECYHRRDDQSSLVVPNVPAVMVGCSSGILQSRDSSLAWRVLLMAKVLLSLAVKAYEVQSVQDAGLEVPARYPIHWLRQADTMQVRALQELLTQQEEERRRQQAQFKVYLLPQASSAIAGNKQPY